MDNKEMLKSRLKMQFLLVPGALLFAILVLSCKGTGDNDASGTFEATEVVVSSEVNGRLLQFDVTEGQLLKAGETVGLADTVQLWLKKLQLRASGKAVNSRRMDIAKQVAATRQQIATQEKERQRFENLLKDNAANRKQLDDINAQIALLQKQLAAQLSTLESGNAGVTEESSAIDIQVAQLDDQLRKSYLSSPIDGTVLAKYTEMGELAVPGKALFKVADVENMFLRAYITSGQLEGVKVGQEVQVFADYGGDKRKEYPGRITWISDKSEFTPKNIQTKDERANLVYAVKVAVKNDGFLKIGMYGELRIPALHTEK